MSLPFFSPEEEQLRLLHSLVYYDGVVRLGFCISATEVAYLFTQFDEDAWLLTPQNDFDRRRLLRGELDLRTAFLSPLGSFSVVVEGDSWRKIPHEDTEEYMLPGEVCLDPEEDLSANPAFFVDGDVVRSLRGIPAKVGQALLEKYQRLVEVVHACFQPEGRADKKRAQLALTATPAGSFGFEFREIPVPDKDGQLLLSYARKSDLVCELSELVTLFECAGTDDEAFQKARSRYDNRVSLVLSDFLGVAASADLSMRVVAGRRETTLTQEQVKAAEIRSRVPVSKETTQWFTGTLLGVLPEARKFEFRETSSEDEFGGAFYPGDIAEHVTKEDIAAWTQKFVGPEVDVNLRIVEEDGKQTRTLYYLLQVTGAGFGNTG